MESTLQIGETLHSSSSAYSILDFIGEGCFGKVAKCLNISTNDTVAIKILKQDSTAILDAERELAMLDLISVRDPDLINVVKFLERFEHLGQTCLVFEMLETDLQNLLSFGPMSVKAIRPMAQQLLVALDALKDLGILHTDIKPDNVMLVSDSPPIRVKLIDFGLATPVSGLKHGQICQPIGYRAPEVFLGLPFNEAIDVWGLGCLLACLYLGGHPFPGHCNYQMMKTMIEFLGQPEDYLLNAGGYTCNFFTKKYDKTDPPTWRLLTPEEYQIKNGVPPQEYESMLPSSLEALAHFHPVDDPAELEDRLAFADLLKGLLHLDGAMRISPRQALQHPFITMSHLAKHSDSSDYPTMAREMMGTPPNSDQESTAGSEDEDKEIKSTLKVGETLCSGSSDYSILDFIGEGCFGKVAKCLNISTNDTVAIKILKQDSTAILDAERELAMLDLISVHNPDLINVVKFLERFEHLGQTCLVFEMLETDLQNLLSFGPMSVKAIRPMAQQLLVALDALKGLGILHTDIKPDNVMLVSTSPPIRVKLIDFGLATPVSGLKHGQICQPIGYRAPEVFLGLPFNEAIDVWGLGCLLASLYLGGHSFPVHCNYQMMKHIIKFLGQPEDYLLNAGGYTSNFFTKVYDKTDPPTWRLLTPEEYQIKNGVPTHECRSMLPKSLDALAHIYQVDDPAELEDRLAFADLLKGLLHLDGAMRISPRQALQHPFITMSHLAKHSDSSDYPTIAREMMGTPPNSDQESTAGSEDARAPCFGDEHTETSGTSDLSDEEAIPPHYQASRDIYSPPIDNDNEDLSYEKATHPNYQTRIEINSPPIDNDNEDLSYEKATHPNYQTRIEINSPPIDNDNDDLSDEEAVPPHHQPRRKIYSPPIDNDNDDLSDEEAVPPHHQPRRKIYSPPIDNDNDDLSDKEAVPPHHQPRRKIYSPSIDNDNQDLSDEEALPPYYQTSSELNSPPIDNDNEDLSYEKATTPNYQTRIEIYSPPIDKDNEDLSDEEALPPNYQTRIEIYSPPIDNDNEDLSDEEALPPNYQTRIEIYSPPIDNDNEDLSDEEALPPNYQTRIEIYSPPIDNDNEDLSDEEALPPNYQTRIEIYSPPIDNDNEDLSDEEAIPPHYQTRREIYSSHIDNDNEDLSSEEALPPNYQTRIEINSPPIDNDNGELYEKATHPNYQTRIEINSPPIDNDNEDLSDLEAIPPDYQTRIEIYSPPIDNDNEDLSDEKATPPKYHTRIEINSPPIDNDNEDLSYEKVTPPNFQTRIEINSPPIDNDNEDLTYEKVTPPNFQTRIEINSPPIDNDNQDLSDEEAIPPNYQTRIEINSPPIDNDNEDLTYEEALPPNYQTRREINCPPIDNDSKEEIPSSMFNVQEVDPFLDGAEQTDLAPPPLTSSRRTNKMMKRICKFFRRVKRAFCCRCRVKDD
ncbi:uncharacterized protein LOC117807313 isoform X2 [Notolabrus celidotus]|uniref:uncharacterized protein LOC117807313 isoform X2 n=1 Tax=Notolabrus celidotus TaxID=1203425 RepID=UPI00148F83FC|nr:uncharacterized protein LOC117807313 isoform X2 [Notolabrus celidotus]